ncbi:hypothetical protein BX661DRAFT_184414 [Kickxella alabastrina]|uniref:uncharacterized protein n=1 Tax=Kickxella alabastrina TaxID=61397 RepID=UPI0022201FE9|nr:uncharacterized protein BX661DRAFT_184414 [Kickxella alabastrina]KAI7825929.1 hypothetical protein BX661DRAFT_184414 [Kickxella alabastrina]KAJ1947181.1 hypothetical protein GGF37_000636 [Kickxella alabastrina]
MASAGPSPKMLIMPSGEPLTTKAVRTGRGAKPHVPSACTNCKKAHLACDLQRPCHRCVNSGKCDTCKDVQHKKRGRPRSKDKAQAAGSGSGSGSGSSIGVESKSPMETQMFQFSFMTESGGSPTATAAPSCSPSAAPSAPPSPKPSHISLPPAACTAHLFLTPGLLCLRLEEPAAERAMLGHSLLSLINRSMVDFISPHDRPAVLAVFESLRAQLSQRLVAQRSVYASSVLGNPPRAVDPNTFQALPLPRLLQRVCSDITGSVRAHLRTASGAHDLFDIHVFVGAVSSPPLATAGVVLDEAYFVCRITRFDALRDMLAVPLTLSPRGTSKRELAEEDVWPSKRRLVGPAAQQNTSCDALYMLAEVTDSGASDEQSTVFSSPQLSASSPSLRATVSSRHTMLPSLADMLRSLDNPDSMRFAR